MKRGQITLEPIVLVSLCGLILLSRIAAICSNNELNIDESLPMVNALRTSSIAPWASMDSTTSGPVSSWFVWTLHQAGMPITYRAIHLVAAICIIFTFVTSWLASRRLFGIGPALVGACAGALWLAFPRKEFPHFSSEIVPISLIGLALLCAVPTQTVGPKSKRIALIVAGVALGLVPWTKLQAAPIAAVLGLFLVVEMLAKPGTGEPRSRRWIDAALMCGAALLPSGLIFTWIARVGALSDFTQSYIVSNLLYAAKPTKQYIIDIIYMMTRRSITPLLIGIGALFLAAAFVRGSGVLDDMRRRRWELSLAVSLLAVSFFACVKPRTQFAHYQLLMLAPTILAIAGGASLLADEEKPMILGGRLSPMWTLSAACVGLPLVIMSTWLATSMRRDIESVRQPTESFPQRQIAGLVKKAVPNIRSVAVWGWEPCIYVDLGLPPVTRHVINHFLTLPGPAAVFLRSRYLDDVRLARPDVILDVGEISEPGDHKPALSSVFPELNSLISEHYDFARTYYLSATSSGNGREVTIYTRRTPYGS
jgi:hypothetical protein